MFNLKGHALNRYITFLCETEVPLVVRVDGYVKSTHPKPVQGFEIFVLVSKPLRSFCHSSDFMSILLESELIVQEGCRNRTPVLAVASILLLRLLYGGYL